MKAAFISTGIVVAVPAVSACEERLPMTALAGAARRGDIVEIDRLIAAGADVDEDANLKGWPPFIHAIHRSFARFRSTLENRLARWQARRRGCDELLRIVGG
jgi:hypothetical protein